MTYLEYYELDGMRDEYIATSDNFWITTGCNIDPKLNYIKITRLKDRSGNTCRLFIDKADYFISDFYLANNEIDEITSILKNNWNQIISMMNEDKMEEKLFPLIDVNLPIPNYNIIKENN